MRVLFIRIASAASFGLPREWILIGGMRIPSPKIEVAAVGMLPGTGPPTSIMWPNMELKPTSSPSKKIGISTIQSLMWLIAPPHL